MPYDAKILRKIRKSQAPITEVFSRAAGYAWLLKQGLVRSRAEPARREGASKARITQIPNRLKLHSEIIHDLQNMADPAQIDCFGERKPRKIRDMEDHAR
jgi:SOS response regulatory protein OraA/RecX